MNLGTATPGGSIAGSFDPQFGLDGTPGAISAPVAEWCNLDGTAVAGAPAIVFPGTVTNNRTKYTTTAPASPGSYIVVLTSGTDHTSRAIAGVNGGEVTVTASGLPQVDQRALNGTAFGTETNAGGMAAAMVQFLTEVITTDYFGNPAVLCTLWDSIGNAINIVDSGGNPAVPAILAESPVTPTDRAQIAADVLDNPWIMQGPNLGGVVFTSDGNTGTPGYGFSANRLFVENPAGISTIDFSSQTITWFDLTPCTGLVTLKMTGYGLTEIAPGFIGELPSLQQIYFDAFGSNNPIVLIKTNAFQGLAGLKNIDLDGIPGCAGATGMTVTFEAGCLNGLANLQTFSCEGNDNGHGNPGTVIIPGNMFVGCNALTLIDFEENSLSQANVDSLINQVAALVAVSGVHGGNLWLDEGGNSPPSSASAAALSALRATYGWTVRVNT